MAKNKKRLEVLEDQAEIHALVARFADASVAADYDEFAGLWTTDGKWTIHEPFQASSEGVENIVEMMRSLRKGREFFVQFAHSGVIELKGKKATARWVMREVSKGPGEVYYNNYALYIDSLRKVERQMEICSKRLSLCMVGHFAIFRRTVFASI